MDILELKSKIGSKYFDYQKLKNALKNQSNPRRFIGGLIRKGRLIRVKKGLYIWDRKVDPTPFSKEILANLIYGPSYVSLEYALSYYGLIPERVESITSVTLKRNNQFITPVGRFEYKHLHKTVYSKGLKIEIIDDEQRFIMATKEKALLDTIALRFHQKDIKKNFINENLRIDPFEFKKLDILGLLELSKFYKASSVKAFISLFL